MKKGKNRSKKTNAAKPLELCIKVVAVMCREFSEIGLNLDYDQTEISAYAEALARLGESARDEEHLTELLYALDEELAQQGVPLNKRAQSSSSAR